jgi:hypothetical protein
MNSPSSDDPLDGLLRDLQPLMARVVQDEATYTALVTILASGWLRLYGGNDPHAAWKRLEARVVTCFAAELRLED